MEIERLKRSHVKRNILIGVIAILIISAIILNFTRAEYRSVATTPLIHSEINYSLADLNAVAVYIQEGEDYTKVDTIPEEGYTLNQEKSYCKVGDNNIEVTINYDTETKTLSVSPLTTKGTKCYLYFDEQLCPEGASACNTILAGRTVETRSLPFITSTKVEGTNGKGDIYQTTDWKGATYYFAGNPSNNWVQFGGYYWRIIRINGDGTIRMIYQGTSANTTGTSTQIQTSAFNSSRDRSEYVGLKYTEDSQHGTNTKSTILTELDDWYTNTSGLTASQYSQYIDTNVGFCSDRNMNSGSSWSSQPSSTIYYAAYGRLVQSSNNVRPSLDCSNSSDILKIPVGLITADEVVYGGLAWNDRTTNNYLYTGQYYWTMSPYHFDSSWARAYVFIVRLNGKLDGSSMYSELGVRPVINLKADVQFIGEGTVNSPFEVVS